MSKLWWKEEDDVSADEKDLTDVLSVVADEETSSKMVSQAINQGSIRKGDDVICLMANYGCTNKEAFEAASYYAIEHEKTALLKIGQCPTIGTVKPDCDPMAALGQWRTQLNAK